MKKTFIVLALILVTGPLWAARPTGEARHDMAAGQCAAHETTVIDSEARCVENGGISIGFTGDDGAKVACMEDGMCRAFAVRMAA